MNHETVAEWWKHAPREEIEKLLNLLTEWSQENRFYWSLMAMKNQETNLMTNERTAFMESMREKGFSSFYLTTSVDKPIIYTVEISKAIQDRLIKIRIAAQSL